MCYNARYILQDSMRRAERKKNFEDMEYYKERLKEYDEAFKDLYYADGFTHPKIPIYTNDEPDFPILSTWGLIPHWTKTLKDGQKFWNNTLNARSESLFEKPSFRDAAKHKRCIIPVPGFFEYHHQGKTKFPFYISGVDDKPLSLAGVWSEWVDKETGEVWKTCSIVTTKANELMAKIHNNPKLAEPRMPVILPEEIEDEWLKEIDPKSDLDIKELKQLCIPFPDDALKAHTVKQLKGKSGIGNVPESSDEFVYEDLELEL